MGLAYRFEPDELGLLTRAFITCPSPRSPGGLLAIANEVHVETENDMVREWTDLTDAEIARLWVDESRSGHREGGGIIAFKNRRSGRDE